MATPQRTMSKWLAGSRSAAALLAACTSRSSRPTSSTNSRNASSCAAKRSSSGLVGGGEVGHQPDRVGPRRQPQRQLAVLGPEPAHAGVELHVHARRGLRHLLASRPPRRRRRRSPAQLVARERPHHEDRRVDALPAAARRPRRPRPPRARLGAAGQRRRGAPGRGRTRSAFTTAQSGFGSRAQLRSIAPRSTVATARSVTRPGRRARRGA